MSRSHRSILLLAATLLSASAGLYAAGNADSAPATNAEAQNCIPLSRIDSTKVLDDQTILFNLTGGEKLVNHLPQRCPGLRMEKAFGYKTSLSELCNTDIIWVVRQTAGSPERGASCGLGKFEPYVEPAGDKTGTDTGKLEPK